VGYFGSSLLGAGVLILPRVDGHRFSAIKDSVARLFLRNGKAMVIADALLVAVIK